MTEERKANQPVNAESSDDDIRDRARELYEKGGELEIDIDADVSRGGEPDPSPGDAGVYVAAWVWVAFEEEGGA